MINFINLMLTLTVTTTILFLFLLLIEKYLRIDDIYLLLKAIGLFCLIPAVVIIVVYFLHVSNLLQDIHTDDFSYMSLNYGLRKFTYTDRNVLKINIVIFTVWCSGFILTFLISMIQSMISLNYLLNRSDLIAEDNPISRVAKKIQKELNINNNILIYQSENISVPFTTGIIKLKIILPNIELKESEWEMVIKHELVHCIRHDVFMKILIRLVQKIHWFNPILLLYNQKFNEVMEYTCDINVVSDYDDRKKRAYGELILIMSKERPTHKVAIGFSYNNIKILKKRMEYIMNTKKSVKKISTIMVMIAFMMVSPVITYASARGMEEIENAIVLKYQEEKSVMISQAVKSDVPIMIDNSGIVNSSVGYLGELNTRGTNNIDTTVSGNGELQFSPVIMVDNSNVRVVIYSDHESDSFRVGIISPDGTRYYSDSERGAVVNTFKISNKGSYIVYIEGKNGRNGNSIHITGTVYINN